MPVLEIVNNTASPSAISDPDTVFSEDLPANATSSFEVSQKTIDNLEDQLLDLASRTDADGAPEFTVDVKSDTDETPVEFSAVADLLRWTGNHIMAGTVVSDPTTPSVVGARRVDVAAGEAMVDGAYFVVSASADEVGDAEINAAGDDVSTDDLAVDEDVYTHVLLVNNADALETVLVRGTGVDNTGSDEAVPLTETQLATAVGAYLGLSAPYRNYVEIATVLFVESTGLTQTTTDNKPVPKAYS